MEPVMFKKSVIDYDTAYALYYQLQNDIEWEEGIKTRTKGLTRKAKAISLLTHASVDYAIVSALNALTKTPYRIHGIYLNYYENETMYTPNHRHKDTHQLIISLGETRTLKVGSKNYVMENGDAIIFTNQLHGIAKEKISKNGRISIATFMTPVDLALL